MIRTCKSCGTKNRIPAGHLADKGKCGSCKAELPPLSEPVAADTALFDEIVRAARVPVLVDFWADWCHPCKMAAPEVHALAHEMSGKALILQVDIDANPELANRYQVQSIPNFVVLRNGQVAFQQAGMVPRAQMRRWLE
jgi:thioredoxin 2